MKGYPNSRIAVLCSESLRTGSVLMAMYRDYSSAKSGDKRKTPQARSTAARITNCEAIGQETVLVLTVQCHGDRFVICPARFLHKTLHHIVLAYPLLRNVGFSIRCAPMFHASIGGEDILNCRQPWQA